MANEGSIVGIAAQRHSHNFPSSEPGLIEMVLGLILPDLS